MSLDRCPGVYCGRTLFENGSWSECAVCPRGFRVNETFACEICENNLNLYSWMFLFFMALMPLMLHFFFIDLDAKDRKFSRKQIILTSCAFVEVVISGLCSVLLMEPVGELQLHSCEVKRFIDFYTLFYNPQPNYETRLHCSSEAVYPLYVWKQFEIFFIFNWQINFFSGKQLCWCFTFCVWFLCFYLGQLYARFWIFDLAKDLFIRLCTSCPY